MWSFLDRFARPPLARHLRDRGAELNHQARACLAAGPAEVPGGRGALVHALAAGDACWYVCRDVLPAQRWQEVRTNLRQQARWRGALETLYPPPAGALAALARHARTPAEESALGRLQRRLERTRSTRPGPRWGRALRQLLRAQAAWHADLAQAPAPPDSALHGGLERLYRKARRAVAAGPRSRRARRRLARLVYAEELMQASSGPIAQGPDSTGITERRRLLVLMDVDAWLQSLAADVSVAGMSAKWRKRARRVLRRRRRELHTDIKVAALLAFCTSVADYRERLPWLTFTGLAGQELGGAS